MTTIWQQKHMTNFIDLAIDDIDIFQYRILVVSWHQMDSDNSRSNIIFTYIIAIDNR